MHNLLVCKRICIIGPSSSGKTTLGKHMADKMGIPFYSLDKVQWFLGWRRRKLQEVLAIHEALIQQDGWIIEGNNVRTIRRRLNRADAVIFLDFGRWAALKRYFQRIWRYYGKRRPHAPEGCHEVFNSEMLRHILITNPRMRKKYLKWIEAHPHLLVYRLERFSDLQKLYQELGLPWGELA